MFGAYGVTASQKKGFDMGASVVKVLGNESKNRFQSRKARGILGYERSKFLPFGCGKWLVWDKNSGEAPRKVSILG